MKKQDRGPAAQTTSDVLRAARALVAKGWTQCRYGSETDDHGNLYVCAGVAIGRAATPTAYESHPDALSLLCRAVGADGSLNLFKWNDATERTHAEVLAAFDRAIEMATAGSAAQPPPASPDSLAAPKEEDK